MRVAYDDLIPTLKQVLPADAVGAIGRLVAFIRRLRVVEASVFVWAAVLSRFSSGNAAFEEARRWYERLSGQLLASRPFHLRFKSPAAVALFERAFEQVVSRWRAQAMPRPHHPIARWFPDVVLWDSTVIQVADQLEKIFPGIRGVPAGLKVSLAVSLYGLVPLYATMCAAACNDMKLFPPLELVRPGSLLLFDRGFVAYERLREISSAGSFYICRHRTDGNALIIGVRRAPGYVRRALQRRPEGVWLRDILPPTKKIRKSWDVEVLLRPDLGRSNMVPARLVIVPGPKGAPRPYLTNLAPRPWNGRALAELYRLRWQIELVFKELKQNLALERIPTKDQNAVQVLAWASLIALALSREVAACFHPIRRLIGLEAALRVELLTRALRSCILLFGRALVAPRREAPVLVRLLVEELLERARRANLGREDSLSRLRRMLPATATA